MCMQVCEPEEESWERNPAPEQLFSQIAENKKDLCILLPKEKAMFTLNRDELCMAVYQPSDRLLRLLDRLATAAGLFLWQPPRKDQSTAAT